MGSLWAYKTLIVLEIGISVCQIKQTIQRNYVRHLNYNISSTSYTGSLQMKTTGHKIQQCFVQCYHTPKCVSLLYSSETTDCIIFSRVLLDPPLKLSNNLVTSYFIAGSSFCDSIGYMYDVRVPFCFKVHNDTGSFYDARRNCELEGGHLIQIDSPAKQEVVETVVYFDHISKYRIDGINTNMTWTFSSGLNIPHSYWHQSRPNRTPGVESCLAINTYLNNKWDDISCRHPWAYICESKLHR